MSIWDYSPKEILGGWEARYRDKSLKERLLTPGWKRKKDRKIKQKLEELCEKKATIKQASKIWKQSAVSLQGYVPYKPVRDIDLREATQETIEAELNRRIQQQDQRIRALSELVAPWGIELDGDLLTLDALQLWFCKYLYLFTKDEFLAYVKVADSTNPYYHRAAPEWCSIGLDISLHMMAMLQKEIPQARWGISRINNQNQFYNRPVLICSENSAYHTDFEPYIWGLMTLLRDYYIPNRFFDDFRKEYKKVCNGWRRVLKKEKGG
jgi:hypothetical protein